MKTSIAAAKESGHWPEVLALYRERLVSVLGEELADDLLAGMYPMHSLT